MSIILKITLLTLVMVLLPACTGSDTGDKNTPPIVNTTIDTTATVGTQTSLIATATDPDGDTLQYAWSITAGPTGSAAALTNADQSTSIFTPDIEGEYSIQLSVSDGSNDVTRTATIQATQSNIAPTARITAPPAGTLNSPVSLDGTPSTDPDGDTLSYHWTFLSRPTDSQAVFNDANTAQTTFTADISGDYQLQLIVNDGELDSTPTTATVTVASENASPIVDITVDTNIAVGEQTSLIATATDPDGDTLQYAWSITAAPTGSAAALINADQSTSTFTPDIEGEYSIQLIVSDGTEDVTRTATIQAMQGNIAPTARITNLPIVSPGSTVQLDGTNSTDPNDDVLSYRWKFLNRPASSQAFFSNANIAKPTFTADLSGDYQIQLIVNDGEFDSASVTTTAVASNFSVTVSWPANADNPAGYTIYVGADVNTVEQLVKILVRGATDWDPAAPAVEIGGDTLLNTLPVNTTQACFAVKAYNGAGLSDLSTATCEQLP